MSLFSNLPPPIREDKGHAANVRNEEQRGAGNAGSKKNASGKMDHPSTPSASNTTPSIYRIQTTTSFVPSSLVRSRKQYAKSSLPSRGKKKIKPTTPTTSEKKEENAEPENREAIRIERASERSLFKPKAMDDYDPASPNDYEKYVETRNQIARARQKQKDLAKQLEEAERERRKRKNEWVDAPRKLGSGLGRGRDLTMPAWMQRKQQSERLGT